MCGAMERAARASEPNHVPKATTRSYRVQIGRLSACGAPRPQIDARVAHAESRGDYGTMQEGK